MRRYPATLAALTLALPLLLAFPQLRANAPHPVTPTVTETAVRTPVTVHKAFQEAGATWTGTQHVQVRTRTGSTWSSWQDLTPDDAAPDDGSKDARHATDTIAAPLWVGPAEQVQVRSAHPTDLKLVLIDPGSSAADTPLQGGATAPQPAIYTRAMWGADERLRSYNGADCAKPDYSDTVKVGFVHHTDNPNGYSAAQVPAIIRSIYAYHVRTKGWCDIGYNFLVDRFGRVWEGRYGGVTKNVIGAHTGGFNTDSFGAALIGTFSGATPSNQMLTALERLFAWKLGQTHVNPLGTAWLTSAGGGTDKYKKGVGVLFHTIAGHRDAGYTDCPGQQVYARLPAIRTTVRALMGANLLDPALAPAKVARNASTTLTAGVLKTQTYAVFLQQACAGTVVRSWSGRASAAGIKQVLDLNGIRPGAYTVYVTSEAGTDRAVPASLPLEITTSRPKPPAQTGAGTAVLAAGYTPISPTTVVSTADQPLGPASRLDVTASGAGSIPATGVQALAVQLTATCASAATHLVAYQADSAAPTTSSLSVDAGQTRTVLTQVALSPSGAFSIANTAGYVDLTATVVGYFSATGQGYHPVAPFRQLDHAALSAGVPALETAGVPAQATAVVANLVSINPTKAGTVSIDGATVLSYPAGRIVANRVVATLTAGTFSLTASSDDQVVLDVVGWYGPGGAAYTAVRPSRALGAVVPSKTPRAITVKVPTGTTAVALTLTARSTTDAVVTTWGSGAKPATSDLNLTAGSAAADLVVVPVTASGQVTVWSSSGTTTLAADLVGYYHSS